MRCHKCLGLMMIQALLVGFNTAEGLVMASSASQKMMNAQPMPFYWIYSSITVLADWMNAASALALIVLTILVWRVPIA